MRNLWVAWCALAVLSAPVKAADRRERPVPNYDEAEVGRVTLPDLLRLSAGTQVRDAATWEAKRRGELLELFAREVYGRTPGGRPERMHWAVTSIDRAALGGKAVRKEVTIWFTEQRDGPRMHVLIYQPARRTGDQAAAPVFLGLNYGNHTVHPDPGITLARGWVRPGPANRGNRATDADRGSSTSRWQVETLLARGYATVTAYCGDLCTDRPQGLSNGIGQLFGTGTLETRAPDAWGAIGMWAWGLSRAMDYIATDPELDASRVAVHGHSRLGKAALWAGAQDARFALVISNESGTGGAKLSRRNYGQTVEDINIAFPYWFCRNFAAYGKNVDALPLDQHALLALIAPRPVHVGSAEDDRWADPRGEFLALKTAEPVYQLYGKAGLGVENLPAPERPIFGDGMAYHLRRGEHDMTAYDWATYLDFADRVFGRRQSAKQN